MRRTVFLQEVKKMRFEEIYGRWQAGRLTPEEAAVVLGVASRTFRWYISGYEEEGGAGLDDRRLTQRSHRKASKDEVFALTRRYEGQHRGWHVKHFYSGYKCEGGQRRYTWVKNTLQGAG